jgi:uncharacterized protein involved in outer membrane biogenesis
MKQTSKVLLGLAIVLAIVIAGAAWFLYANLDSLVAAVIEREGSVATGTRVTVGGVSIDLPDGRAGISRLAVANPDGFSDEPAVALGDFTIRMDPMAATENPLVIEHVAVDGARLRVEQQGTRNNLKTILASLGRGAEAEADPEADAVKLVIERFELANAGATLSIPELGQERSVELPDIVLTDVGRATGGATAAGIAEQLLRPMLEAALQRAAAGGLQDRLRERLDESVPDAGRELLDRFGRPPADEPADDSGDDPADDDR